MCETGYFRTGQNPKNTKKKGLQKFTQFKFTLAYIFVNQAITKSTGLQKTVLFLLNTKHRSRFFGRFNYIFAGSFSCGDKSKGTTTLKLIFRPILNIPGCTPGGTTGLSKYLSLL